MTRRAITAVALAGLFIAACGGARIDTSASVLDGAWQLESGTLDGEPVPLVPGYRITFTASGSRFSGTAACNGYGGLFAVEAWELTLHEFSITEMACMPDVMESEAAYVFGIQRVDTAARDGEALVLSGPEVELRFTPLPPVPVSALIGTVWVLDGLISGETVSSVAGETATLELHDDGTVTAGTGCRTLNGTFIAIGDEISTPELSADGECPAELGAQDNHVVGVIEGGFTATIDGNRLTLSAAGNEGLLYRSN